MMGRCGVLQRWVHPPVLPSGATVVAPQFSRFRPSVRAAPTMPSADFCPAVKTSSPVFSRCRFRINDTGQISRGKTRILPRIDAGFTKCIPFADGGLGGHVPTGPGCITPHIRFLFIVPRFRLGGPKHPASRRRTCPLANLRLCEYLVPGLSPDWIRAMHGTHVEIQWAAKPIHWNAGLGLWCQNKHGWHNSEVKSAIAPPLRKA